MINITGFMIYDIQRFIDSRKITPLDIQQSQYGIFNDVRAICDNMLPIQNTCS